MDPHSDTPEKLKVACHFSRLSGIRQSRWPSFIHFDLSRFGHSSLELRSVGPRPFPPTSSGYTFMAWIQIATFDPKMNLTILSLQDASQKCNVSFYIDKDTQSPILQTSSSRTTKFNNFKFGTGKWYHVAIVHHRPRVSSTSGVSLFVDGQLVEVGRATWPSQPAAYFPVQGFFGTPKSAVGSEGLKDGRRSGLKWNLGPTWLIDGDLSEDMIYVSFDFLFCSLVSAKGIDCRLCLCYPGLFHARTKILVKLPGFARPVPDLRDVDLPQHPDRRPSESRDAQQQGTLGITSRQRDPRERIQVHTREQDLLRFHGHKRSGRR